MVDHEATFNLSYWRVMERVVNDTTFIDAFYDRFLSSSTEVRDKFAKTDFRTQKNMLLLSILHVSAFWSSGESNHVLNRLADRHSRKDLDIEPRLYDFWFDSLLKTVEIYDAEFDEIIDAAWRHVMTPGIEFMKSKHSD